MNYIIYLHIFSITYVNLKQHMPQREYMNQWRYRVESIRVFLLDKDGNVIPNRNADENGFIVTVTFPMTFIDLEEKVNSREKIPHIFKAAHFNCWSRYQNQGEGEFDILRQCKVKSPFSEQSFFPTPDGVYQLELQDLHGILNRSAIDKIRIAHDGSSITNSKKRHHQSNKVIRMERGDINPTCFNR